MLLFISMFKNCVFKVNVFQYISCYCLSHFLQTNLTTVLISIHLMLLFIGISFFIYFFLKGFQYISCYCLSMEKFSGKDFKKEFQYISCYCLSVFHIPLWGYKLYFNTSHVIVYLPEPYPPISKYCSFQYISCYCLSNMIIRCLQHIRYFNTSHVIVYLYRFHSRYPLNLNFNTSHVIVYHSYL